MKTIGFIMGTGLITESNDYNYKHKKQYSYLDELPKEFNYDPDEYGIDHDLQIYAELKLLETKYNCNVVAIYGPTMTLEDLNKCDAVYCYYEFTYSMRDNGYEGVKEYFQLLQKTKAVVYPTVKTQKFILSKQTYMKFLKKKGFDTIPTKFVPISTYKKQKVKTIDSILDYIDREQYDKVIMKPELAGFALGFKLFKNPTETNITKYMDQMVKHKYQKVLIQPYIQEFTKFWEFKMMWFNGVFHHAYGQKVHSLSDDDRDPTYEELLASKHKPILLKCKAKGSKIVKQIIQEFGKQAVIRVDFGCCIDNDSICREYFVNEVECAPAMSDDETKKNNLQSFAKAILTVS